MSFSLAIVSIWAVSAGPIRWELCLGTCTLIFLTRFLLGLIILTVQRVDSAWTREPGRAALHNMPILSRLPNIISSSLSSAPQEPSQKSKIDELVQKTRTFELTISRLREQLSDSRSERQAERKEWAGECETVMGFYRIAHLQKNVLLAQERVALEHERDRTRKERVAVIERNYYLVLSRAKEKELEIELKEKEYLLNDAEKAREAAEVR
jgi:hypothetical protein